MIVVDTQIHGYLRGHQLLSSSVDLPKVDQSVIDRLSDVAGPLRPNEKFDSYLSGYPLPSGNRYVLARTWQDLTVTRAGCVRTLSLVILDAEWAGGKSLQPFLDLLDPSEFPEAWEAEAHQVMPSPVGQPMPPVPDFRGGELLEALFLEETKPIVVFGAPTPELIATRLITAVWADFRRHFAFSTFARSPRRVEGRLFDLVFAPKDARSKFADWPGRRVDGVADSVARHRWTKDIVERAFVAPVPRLLSERDVKLAGPNDAKNAALLRISLLWDELVGKVHTTPTAALGLLDIAESRGVWNLDTLEALDRAIETAAGSAIADMSPDQAWEFVTALVRKMRGHSRGLENGRLALRDVAARLSISSPQGAAAFLSQPLAQEVRSDLLPAIAGGMAHASDEAISSAMMSAAPDVLGRILVVSDSLAKRIVGNPHLLDRVRATILDLKPHLLVEVREKLLPLLVEERQLSLAGPFIAALDLNDLMDEVRHLNEATSLAVPGFTNLLVDRARELDGVGLLRDLLLELSRSDGRDRTLFATLTPSHEDVSWLLDEHRIPGDLVRMWLVVLLGSASPSDFVAVFHDAGLRDQVLAALPTDALEIRRRILFDGRLSLDIHVALLLDLLPALERREARDRVCDALSLCLRTHFGLNEEQTIIRLLGAMGGDLDAGWAVRHGLERGVSAAMASRNLVAFNSAPALPRGRIMAVVDDLARALDGRHVIDVDLSAIDAAANLLADANHYAWSAALAASARLLPLLMRSGREPVSALVAVAFPVVYQEYAKADDIPDFLKFVPFVDWDRCKSARHELVSTFLASSAWAPGDLALTSCRCGDVGKIFRRVAKSYGGDAYLSRVLDDLGHLQANCRSAVEQAISDSRSAWSSYSDRQV